MSETTETPVIEAVATPDPVVAEAVVIDATTQPVVETETPVVEGAPIVEETPVVVPDAATEAANAERAAADARVAEQPAQRLASRAPADDKPFDPYARVKDVETNLAKARALVRDIDALMDGELELKDGKTWGDLKESQREQYREMRRQNAAQAASLEASKPLAHVQTIAQNVTAFTGIMLEMDPTLKGVQHHVKSVILDIVADHGIDVCSNTDGKTFYAEVRKRMGLAASAPPVKKGDPPRQPNSKLAGASGSPSAGAPAPKQQVAPAASAHELAAAHTAYRETYESDWDASAAPDALLSWFRTSPKRKAG